LHYCQLTRRYGKTKYIFEFSTTKLVKPTYVGFYRRQKKRFCLQASVIVFMDNCAFTKVGTKISGLFTVSIPETFIYRPKKLLYAIICITTLRPPNSYFLVGQYFCQHRLVCDKTTPFPSLLFIYNITSMRSTNGSIFYIYVIFFSRFIFLLLTGTKIPLKFDLNYFL
jgi:hypothetical protein